MRHGRGVCMVRMALGHTAVCCMRMVRCMGPHAACMTAHGWPVTVSDSTLASSPIHGRCMDDMAHVDHLMCMAHVWGCTAATPMR